ncbi:MAG: hypothetical protein J6Y08_03245 [Clostridiales bacterium]|nr:hypothetical protein [Clostridiales bacterium]
MSKERKELTLAFPQGESLPVWQFCFSSILATVLGVACVVMLLSTYRLSIDYVGVAFYTLGISLFFSYIFARNDIRLTLLSLGGVVLITTVFLAFDLFSARYAAEYFYGAVADLALRFLPGGSLTLENGFAMSVFFSLVSAFPAILTTWVIARKKNVLIAFLGYLPFVILTVSLNYQIPTQGSCQVVIAGFLLLVIYSKVRKNAKEPTYCDLMKIMVPILVGLCIIGIFNPQKKYRQDEMAQKQYLAMQQFLEKVSEKLPFGTGKKIQEEVVKEVEKTYMGSLVIEDVARHTLRMSVGRENLLMAGNFNPPRWKFMTVTRMSNELYTGNASSSGPYMYLKTASMSRFDGYSWAAPTEEMPFSYYYPPDNISQKEAQSVVRIKVDFRGDYAFVPYYTDHYRIDPSSSQYITEPYLILRESSIMNEKTLIPDASQDYFFVYSEVPVRSQPEWSDEYIRQIYLDCLYVPDATREGILLSETLPQWYLDVLYGKEEWPTERKVRAVVSYVRTLHEYDALTRFPPDDVDFVTWFMRYSKTGFCVHYASTAAVLLRMLGVPTRYVSGYLLTDVQDGVACDVYTTDAHAWIEYFHPDYGWIMDDPTPGNEEAASHFNFDAIVQEYGPETSMVTPVPLPSRTPTPTINPYSGVYQGAIGNQGDKELSEGQKLLKKIVDGFVKIFIRVMIVVAIIAAVVLTVRGIFHLYWKKRFGSEDQNLRARSYYHYYAIMAKILKSKPTDTGERIAGQAAFSRQGVKEEDVLELIRSEQKNLDEYYKKAKDIRQNIFDLLVIRMKAPPETAAPDPDA